MTYKITPWSLGHHMQKFLYTAQWQDNLKRTWKKAVLILLTSYPEIHVRGFKKTKRILVILDTKSVFPEDLSEACHSTGRAASGVRSGTTRVVRPYNPRFCGYLHIGLWKLLVKIIIPNFSFQCNITNCQKKKKVGETLRQISAVSYLLPYVKTSVESSNVSTRDTPKSALRIAIIRLFGVCQIHTCCGLFWHVLQR